MCNLSGPVIVQMRERDFILGPHRMPEYNLTDIIKLIPVLIKIRQIPIQWFKLRSSRDGYI